ncbi:MAG: hypothetical protein V3R29_02400 [Candidatus Acidoferrales bacterium]
MPQAQKTGNLKDRTNLTGKEVEHLLNVHIKVGVGCGIKLDYDPVCPRPPCPLPRPLSMKEMEDLLEGHIKVTIGSNMQWEYDPVCPRPPCPLP